MQLSNPSVDHYPAGTQTESPFSLQFSGIGIQDIWRQCNPSTLQYSCCSSTYQSLSRIDLALGTDQKVPRLLDVSYRGTGLSDHSPLLLSFHTAQPKWKCWRVSPFWLKVLPRGERVKRYLTEFFQNNKGSSSPLIVWDTMKAYFCGVLIKELSILKNPVGTGNNSYLRRYE